MCLFGTTEGLTERKTVLPAQEGVYSELAQGKFLFPHYLYLVEIGFHRILVTGEKVEVVDRAVKASI